MAEKNKVKYGLSNVHYAMVKSEDETGKLTYDKPQPWPGAVSVAFEAQGETTKFRADNVDYFVSTQNNGYSGDLESAMIPDALLKEALGEKADTNGATYEYSDAKQKAFALMFEFEGDVNKIRHCMFNCKCDRPNIEGETTDKGNEPKTEKTTITVSPRINDKLVKGRCGDAEATAYNNWYKDVPEPTVAGAGA